MAGKVHAFLVGLGVFLMVVAGVLTIQLVSTASPPDREIDAAPTSRTPSPSRAVGTGTPSPSATPTTPTTTILPSTTPPRTTVPPTTTTSTPPAPPTWTLVWSDDFNSVPGTGWSTASATSPDHIACVTIRPENLFVASGVLGLRALREDYECGGQTRSYTTAHIVSTGSFTYGAFEIRAKAPNSGSASLGLWPSLWLGAADGIGAIDVAAFYGGSGYAGATQAVYCSTTQQSSYAVAGGAAGDFHLYRVEWESGVLRWYVDGTLVWTRDASTTPDFATYFAKPYRLNLSFPVGGSGGDPSGATLPADFQVDYVKVFRR